MKDYMIGGLREIIVEEVLALLEEVFKGEYEASKNDLRQMSLKAIAANRYLCLPQGVILDDDGKQVKQ